MHRLFLFVLLAAVGMSQTSGEFRYPVKRDKLMWGGESGILAVGEHGIQYRSENGETTFDFAFVDIRKADVSDPRRIILYTYDRAMKRLTGPRRFEFNLYEGTTGSGLTQFLAAHLERPVVGAYPVEKPNVEIPAYHRHVWGGCHGVLQFGSAGVSFESKDPRHSRTWPYKDIQSIGTVDPFNFRVTSYAESYSFDLKQRLLPEDYRTLWRRVYISDLHAREMRGPLLDWISDCDWQSRRTVGETNSY